MKGCVIYVYKYYFNSIYYNMDFVNYRIYKIFKRIEWMKNSNFSNCWFCINIYFDGFIYLKYFVLELIVI